MLTAIQMKKKYINSRLLKIPRLLELFIHTAFFISILAVLEFLHINDIVFDTSFNINSTFSVVFMSFSFIIYRILTSHTIVEEFIIDYERKEIEFAYVLLFIIKKKLIIPFKEFSFYSTLDIILAGGALSLRIYKGNQMKIKMNHRYGWTRKQIYCINNDFLKITDGHVRKEDNWQEFYTLVKEKDMDCSDCGEETPR